MRFFLVAFVMSTLTAFGAAQQQAATSHESTAPMPQERARATLEDSRFKAFLKVVNDDLGGRCDIPQYDKIASKVHSYGQGDFSSTYYEFEMRCSTNLGLTGLSITVEFSPLNPTPLNLDLCLCVHHKK